LQKKRNPGLLYPGECRLVIDFKYIVAPKQGNKGVENYLRCSGCMLHCDGVSVGIHHNVEEPVVQSLTNHLVVEGLHAGAGREFCPEGAVDVFTC